MRWKVRSAPANDPTDFDVDGQGTVDDNDLRIWVHDIRGTWLGDANLDGEFNSGDLVVVLGSGEYEDAIQLNSTWSTGDWNADREFTSTDLVAALADGGYEQGPRPAVGVVPEPKSIVMLAIGLIGAVVVGRFWHRSRFERADTAIRALLLLLLLARSALRADIYRWDTGDVIPGTEGIDSGQGILLSFHNTNELNLQYADFSGGQNLYGASFYSSWLDNADLSGANLTNADLRSSTLTGAILTGANLTGVTLQGSQLTNVDLTGALVRGTSFDNTTGFTKDQLYSTQSYQNKDLTGIGLGNNDLTGWDFSGQNLAYADLAQTGFTKEQLYSTQSYRDKDLTGIGLGDNDLTGWDFTMQNLTSAALLFSTLTNGQLTGAKLTSVDVYSSTLTNANLSGANLASANLIEATLTNANLAGANLRNASFIASQNLSSAVFDSTTVYNQWTIFPDDFDPASHGLTLAMSLPGDFDGDDKLTVADVDLLSRSPPRVHCRMVVA